MSARATGAAGAAGVLLGAAWWRRHPSACPYGQRFWVEAPHPLIADEAGLANLRPAEADARELPHPDGAFDAAFLVCVLGEVPDQGRALAELRRVLKPGGRLVVGELVGDPHMVTLGALRRRATDAGLRLEKRIGPRFGYFARLVRD